MNNLAKTWLSLLRLVAAGSSLALAAGCSMGADSSTSGTHSGQGSTPSTGSHGPSGEPTTATAPTARPSYLPAKLGHFQPDDTITPAEFNRMTTGANRAAVTVQNASRVANGDDTTSYLNCKANGMYAERQGRTFMIVHGDTMWYRPETKTMWEKSTQPFGACTERAPEKNKQIGTIRVVTANATKTVFQYDQPRDDTDSSKGKENLTVTIENSTGRMLRSEINYRGEVSQIKYSGWGEPVTIPAAPDSKDVTPAPEPS